MRILVVVVVLAILAGGPLSAQAVAPSELRLGPGDHIRILVAAEPGLSGDFFIDSEGTTLVPVVGLVQVGGRPFREVAVEIRAGFAREVSDPVQIVPLLRIAVLGEVRQPGLYPIDPTMTLRDVLAVAGGLTPSARRDDVRLVRGELAIVTSTDEGVTPSLMSGDQLVVGRRGWLSENGTLFVGAAASVLAALVTGLVLR